jgi:hypothetical protein
MTPHGTLGDIIRASCVFARRQGYRIARGDWGVNYHLGQGWQVTSDSICPLAAVLLEHQPHPNSWDDVYFHENAISELLNASPTWLDDFTEGVDKGPGEPNAKNYGAREAGHQLAQELIDGVVR